MINSFTQTNFTGGEISPRLLGRSDLNRYSNGARTVRNFVVQKHGGLDRRPGTEFIAKTKHSGMGTPSFACVGSETEEISTVTYGPIQTLDAYPKTVANNADAGDVAWENLSRALGAPTGAGANADSMTLGQTSNYLQLTNYSFSIPSDAAIVGIKVTLRTKVNVTASMTDHTVQLIVGGSRVGDNNASGNIPTTSFADVSYGDEAELWGLTPTLAQVMASNFGVAIRYERTGSNGSVQIDGAKITIYFRTVSTDTTTVTLLSRGEARLIPFQFSADQSYVLEFGHLYMRVFSSDGQILSSGDPYEIVTPYEEGQLSRLKFVQSADVLYICHPDHAPREVLRTADDDWTIQLFDADDGPYLSINTDTTKLMAVSSITPGSVTLTASGAGWGGTGPFVATHAASASRPGLRVRIKTTGTDWGWGIVTGYTSSLVVTITLVDAPASTATTANWRLGAWSVDNGWPNVPVFHADRLWFGGSDAYPQTMWGSEVSIYDSFQPSDLATEAVSDSDSVVATISDDQVNTIVWMEPSSRGLVIGTIGGEFIGSSSDLNGIITPTSIKIVRQSKYGSLEDSRPLQVGGSILFIQRHGRKLREMTYQFDLDQHVSADLTVMSEHLGLNRFQELAHQGEPYSLVWIRDQDGDLFSMTFDREQEVVGWASHVIGGTYGTQSARVDSLCVISDDSEDRVWMVVRREINGRVERYVERLADYFEEDEDVSRTAFFVDSGLTYDGWNYDVCDTMNLTIEEPPTEPEEHPDADWAEDEYGYLEADGHSPFTAESVGRIYRLDGDPLADEELWIDMEVTEYISATIVQVRFRSEIPDSLRNTPVSNWALLASSLSGLEHLEGETIAILTDGGTHPDTLVSGGALDLESGEFMLACRIRLA
jgi:hypothetical protein